MKITALEISQFMRVECVSMTFAPTGAITIAGDNGSGKTSVQTFIELCFGGKDKCPTLPVKVGAKKAIGKLTLDDEGRCVTIEVEVSPDRTVKATVRQDGGKPFDGPISLLKAMVSKYTFDPFALLALKGQDQRRVMLDCLGVNFDDLESKAEKIKDERRDAGRDVHGREKQIESMPEHAGVPSSEVNMGAVAAELQKAIAHNGRCKEFADACAEWRDEVDAADLDVETLEKRLVEARKRAVTARAGQVKAAEDAGKLKPIDVAPIQKKLADADAINAKVRANKARASLVEQYQKDHDRFEELGKALLAIERQKQDRLNAAKCPVKGLEFRDDGVWYQGLPLAQDMESDQMIRAVQLVAELNPRLTTMFIDNAERMLPAKMKEMDEWADANGRQIICFKAATISEGCEFYLQDGRIQS